VGTKNVGRSSDDNRSLNGNVDVNYVSDQRKEKEGQIVKDTLAVAIKVGERKYEVADADTVDVDAIGDAVRTDDDTDEIKEENTETP
jgi:hypothetical protein